MKKWTEKEVEFLKKNYKQCTNHELAKKLNTTEPSIEHKLARMNLKKGKSIHQMLKKFKEVLYVIENLNDPEFKDTGGFYT